MKAVIVDAPPELIEERKRHGLDRLDEVWEGVYHVVPVPAGEHQRIVDRLFLLFGGYAESHRLGELRTHAAVRDMYHPKQNYRIPEWVFVRSHRSHLFKKEHGYVDEGPDVILEVRSPGDETDEKIPFYEKVGVRELLIVDRDTRTVQILRLVNDRLVPVSPNAEGWIYCEGLRAFFKPALRILLELDRTEHSV